VMPALACAWVVVVLLLALVDWDRQPVALEPEDTSRGTAPG
jgi:hypothetical protein